MAAQAAKVGPLAHVGPLAQVAALAATKRPKTGDKIPRLTKIGPFSDLGCKAEDAISTSTADSLVLIIGDRYIMTENDLFVIASCLFAT